MPHRKLIAAGIVGLLAFLPVAARALTPAELQTQINALLAQVATLQKQLGALQGPATTTPAASVPPKPFQERLLVCSLLTRNLSVGSQGSDVSAVQEALARDKDVYPEGLVTGYFGPLTSQALKRLRVKMVSAGFSAAYPPSGEDGVLGSWLRPMARSYWCDSPKSNAQSAPLAQPSATATPFTCPSTLIATPTQACVGQWEKVYRTATCHIGWKCAPKQVAANQAPMIESLDGPVQIRVGRSYTWEITARDPEGEKLQYRVVWGDESYQDILLAFAGLAEAVYTDSPRFTHTYTKIGSYSMAVTVRDASGNESSVSLRIEVQSPTQTTCTTDYAPVCGSIVVQCITTPCNPIPQTFSNLCEMNRAGATYISPGACTSLQVPATPASGFAPPAVAVPSGMTSCVTPVGNRMVASGGTVSLAQFFATSTNALPDALAKCITGRWYQCDAQGNNCALRHVLPHNPASGLPGYATIAGASCTPGRTTEVMAQPGTLVCRRLECAMTQEDTRVSLSCTQENHWTEVLTQ